MSSELAFQTLLCINLKRISTLSGEATLCHSHFSFVTPSSQWRIGGGVGERGCNYYKRIYSSGSKFFSFRVDLFSNGFVIHGSQKEVTNCFPLLKWCKNVKVLPFTKAKKDRHSTQLLALYKPFLGNLTFLLYFSTRTPTAINFPFFSNGKLMVFRCPSI